MSKNTVNSTFKQQQKRLVRSTFKKGFISAVYPSKNTVDVAFADNPLTIMRNVPIANNVTIANVQAGQRCKVDVFDETNPNDCVCAYTY